MIKGKSTLINLTTKILIKLLKKEALEDHLLHKFANFRQDTPELELQEDPYYQPKRPNRSSHRDDVVFITSRFRSGSTLLWNMFRTLPNVTAYYEPFNERQWFNTDIRGQHTDDTHRGVNDYWSEYNGLESLERFYSKSWIDSELMMTSQSWNSDMKNYIDALIENSKGVPVLQFNRIDFRLPWLKHHYPNAKFIHLYRDPRDQWCSFLSSPKLMDKDNVEQTYRDSFYLDVWCNDLRAHFPFLDKKITPHPYRRFYFLWLLSFSFGKKYCDHYISFEELTSTNESYLKNLCRFLDISEQHLPSILKLIDTPPSKRWMKYADDSWFSYHESYCVQELELWLKRA